jgi:hypothetical protein
MMKHKLSQDEPNTMVEIMTIADKYATVDFASRLLALASEPAKKPLLPPSGPLGQHLRDQASITC